jgi:hypothetical protein
MLGAAARSTGSDAYVAGSATASGATPPLQPVNPIAAHHQFMHDELTVRLPPSASWCPSFLPAARFSLRARCTGVDSHDEDGACMDRTIWRSWHRASSRTA